MKREREREHLAVVVQIRIKPHSALPCRLEIYLYMRPHTKEEKYGFVRKRGREGERRDESGSVCVRKRDEGKRVGRKD